MTPPNCSVAMLAANPSFASILCGALEDHRGYRVPSFGTVAALMTYMRIAPVDVLVLDAEIEGVSAGEVVQSLRALPKLANPYFHVIMLTRAAAPFHRSLLADGADAVLQKSIAPAQLLACIDTLLAADRGPGISQRTKSVVGALRARLFEARPVQAERIGNVIPLFGEGRAVRSEHRQRL